MTGFTLKMIALLSMILDHAAVTLNIGYRIPFLDTKVSILRIIGRLAFVLYAFLVAEGVLHTSNWKKYAGRLFLLAILSEIPFDLAIFQQVGLELQNVFFTLLLGMLAVQGDLYFQAKGKRPYGMIVLFGCCMLSGIFRTDYAVMGVLMIFWFYFARGQNVLLAAGIVVLNLCAGGIQIFGMLALIPILFYNGKRGYSGRIVNRVFYLSYPLHLLLLYAVWIYERWQISV